MVRMDRTDWRKLGPFCSPVGLPVVAVVEEDELVIDVDVVIVVVGFVVDDDDA